MSRRFAIACYLLGSCWCLAPKAMAHPGHGSLPTSSESVIHYAFEPLHALPSLGLGILLFIIVRWLGKRHSRRQREAQ